nr:hypothetical protein LNSESKQC_LNSESKQC_CDS_0005 [Microvirus sp.]
MIPSLSALRLGTSLARSVQSEERMGEGLHVLHFQF